MNCPEDADDWHKKVCLPLVCLARRKGYANYCTRPRGHKGRHHDHTRGGACLGFWSDKDKGGAYHARTDNEVKVIPAERFLSALKLLKSFFRENSGELVTEHYVLRQIEYCFPVLLSSDFPNSDAGTPSVDGLTKSGDAQNQNKEVHK